MEVLSEAHFLVNETMPASNISCPLFHSFCVCVWGLDRWSKVKEYQWEIHSFPLPVPPTNTVLKGKVYFASVMCGGFLKKMGKVVQCIQLNFVAIVTGKGV